MNWPRFAILLVIITLGQASFVDAIAISDIKPDFLLVLLVFFAIYASPMDAIITSFIIGFAADIALGTTLGPRIIAFGLFGTLLSNLNCVIAIRRFQFQSLAIFVTGLLAGIVVWILTLLRRQPLGIGVWTLLFGVPLYSAAVGPLLFIPSAWWMSIKTHRFSKQPL